jgi:uncharacterized sporulation protein YeaH/YhbH (DUF444 family)/spore cortex formation protein SpoVR/YcgB (stage V sporulation)
MISSGTNDAMMPPRETAFKEVYDTAIRKGYHISRNIFTHFIEPNDMAALLATGAHPAPHAHDGRKVLQAAAEAAYVYEFIWPSEQGHHQYFRTVNTLPEDIRTAGHTCGHMDFAETSLFNQSRQSSPVEASYAYAQIMEQATQLGYREEAARLHQLFLSATHLQDFRRGSFEHPDSFLEKMRVQKNELHVINRGSEQFVEKVWVNKRIPRSPTPSVLQFIANHLPEEHGSFARDMIKKFEETYRAFPWVSQTKFMNEGWSVFSEWFILKDTKYNTMSDAVTFAQVSSASWSKSLTNPYWLGSQAWFNLYYRFMDQPEMKALPLEEAELKFKKYADGIIQTHNDFQFIRMALDDKWVMKHSFFLYGKRNSQWGGPMAQAVTIDSKRVIERIAHLVLNPDLRLPSIELFDSNDDKGVFSFRHNIERQIPLERRSMAKTLYQWAQIMRKPVSIDTTFSHAWNFKAMNWWDFIMQPDFWGQQVDWEDVMKKIAEHQKTELDTWPMKVTVKPNGEVTVDYPETITVEEDGQQVEKKKPDWVGMILYRGKRQVWWNFTPDRTVPMIEELQGAVDVFKIDMGLSYDIDNAKLADVPKSTLDALQRSFMPAVEQVPAMKVNAPTAPQAVLEFLKTSKLRYAKILKLMIAGKWAYEIANGFVVFRLDVEVPEFKLDRRVMKKRKDLLPPTPVDGTKLPANFRMPDKDVFGNEYLRDEDTDLGEHPGIKPGDQWPLPPDGDGDDGDDTGDDNKPGKGDPKDPSIVRIPLKDFIEYLVQELNLRNLRKTEGGDLLAEDEIRFGRLQNDGGERIEDETARRVIEKAMAILRSQGIDPRTKSALELLKLGMRYHTPDDIVVPNRETVPTPDKKAVLVWARDSSGSMSEEHVKIIDQFVGLAEALLLTQYPTVEHVFVLASDDAREVSRDDFFSMHFGGGTQMNTAVIKQREIMNERFPREQYNRFGFLFSDGDDFASTETIKEVEALLPNIELYGYGHIEPNAMGPVRAELSGMFKALAHRKPEKTGYSEFSGTQDSLIRGLKAYFAEPEAK